MKVTRYTPVNKGNLLGFCSVLMDSWGEFYINDIGVYQKNGKRWVNFPSRKYSTEEGDKYAPYCGFVDRDTKDKFEEKLLAAVDTYCKENQNKAAPSKSNDEVPF